MQIGKMITLAALLLLIPSATLVRGSGDDTTTPCHNAAGNNNFDALSTALMPSTSLLDRANSKTHKLRQILERLSTGDIELVDTTIADGS